MDEDMTLTEQINRWSDMVHGTNRCKAEESGRARKGMSVCKTCDDAMCPICDQCFSCEGHTEDCGK